MELQFFNQEHECLQSVLCEAKAEEVTQEFRLTDGMPDVGNMIGAWGQAMVRSKEWHDRNITVSGGVTAWAMYTPENGGTPESVEVWIPFRMQWEIPEMNRDGTIVVNCRLKSVDARSVSARRIFFRAVVCVTVEALAPTQVQIYKPVDIPQDVQLLYKKYPMRLPMEAGEKVFILDEELMLSVESDGANKLVRCCVQPEITDKKVMADKAVFRGTAIVDVLCSCDGQRITKQSFEVPFSQFTELSKEYGPGASLFTQMALTSVEPELLEDGCVRIKIGMICQYVVYDQDMIEIIEDAYSTKRNVELQLQMLEIPVILEEKQERIRAEQPVESTDFVPTDVCMFLANPEIYHDYDNVSMNLSGVFHYMTMDHDDSQHGHTATWKQMLDMCVDHKTKIFAWSQLSGKPQTSQTSDGLVIKQDVLLDIKTVSTEPIRTVCGLTLGDMVQEEDVCRPSLILCRAENKSLWELAKENGSTMEAISQINELTEEPEENKMLLIPVL